MSTPHTGNSPVPPTEPGKLAESPLQEVTSNTDVAASTREPLGSSTSGVGGREALKAKVRLVGSLIIALAAVVVLFTAGPSHDDARDLSTSRAAIWVDDEANQSRTEGAPQQQVVNGWTGNALLDLISEQLDAATAPAKPDNRPAVLLTLGVLLLALTTVTTPQAAHQRIER